MRIIVVTSVVLCTVYLVLTRAILTEPPTRIRVTDPVPTTIRDLAQLPAGNADGQVFVITGTVNGRWRVGDMVGVDVSDETGSLTLFSDRGGAPHSGERARIVVVGQPSVTIGGWHARPLFAIISWSAIQ